MTTSWDDGSPLDWRLAELLDRHDLPGTFYLPRRSQRPTMGDADVRRLADRFEVGGHTLDHLALTDLDDDEARRQVEGSKAWLEGVSGRPCVAFCPPRGRFRRRHLPMIRRAGFDLVRTVELLSLDAPRWLGGVGAGVAVLPTTVQAFPHAARAYAYNALKRGAAGNLWRCARDARGRDWVGLCRSLLGRAARRGGVVHLWGHSWEIDEAGQWGALEEALRLLRDGSDPACRLTNGQLADRFRPADT